MKREASIELYRMLLMVGICLMHTLQASGLGMSPLSHLMEGCVDGFVFISGWFGVKFSWNKLLRLYAVALWCAAVCASGLVVNNHFDGVEFDFWLYLRSTWTQFGYYWFVHAYALLMVLAPYVNAAFERTKSIRFYLPFLVFSFGLSFAAIVPGLKGLIPLTPGLNPHAGLTLLGVYIVARLVRLHGLDEKVRTRWLLALLLPSIGFAALNLVKNNSPFTLILAAVTFLLIRRVSLPGVIGRAACWLGPSMFSVYLLHCSGFGSVVMNRCLAEFHPSVFLSVVITVLVLFIGSVLLDLPRRMVVSLLLHRN